MALVLHFLMEPPYSAIDFLSVCSQESCFPGQRVTVCLHGDSGTATNRGAAGSSFPRNPEASSNWAFTWPRGAALSQFPTGCWPSWSQIRLLEPGRWQGAQAHRNKPPLPLSQDISQHKNCQSTGDGLITMI